MAEGCDSRLVPTDSSLLMGAVIAHAQASGDCDARLVPTDSSLLMGAVTAHAQTSGGLPRDDTGARFYWQLALRCDEQALPIAIIRQAAHKGHFYEK
jgi:hypothetical protein